jgi:hypothetical protein
VAAAGLLAGAGLAAAGVVDRVTGVAAAGPRLPTALPSALPTVLPTAGDPSARPAPPDFRAIVEDVVAARERSLRAGDGAALDTVYAPGTAAAAADAALLAEHGPLDVDLEVGRVSVVAAPASPSPSAQMHVVVDVVLETRPAGGPGAGVEAATDTVRLRLDAGPGPAGWRISRVTAPS